MIITKENVDKLNALLRIHIEQTDYENKVDEALRNYKKKAAIKGFRPGMVPIGMIKKMIGSQVLAEEVNKLVNESVFDYLKKENIRIIGEPLFNEKEQPSINWDAQKEFDFVFDLGLTPELNIELSKKIKIPFYRIEIEEKNTNDYIEEYCRQFGRFKNVDEVAPDDMIRGNIRELDANRHPLEGGITTQNTPLVLSGLKNEESKQLFINRKPGDAVVVDFRKAIDSDTELAALLAISKEKVTTITSLFEFTITEVLRYEKAEVNEELYKKVFGPDSTISNEKEFRDKINEQIALRFEAESNFRFVFDVKNVMLEKSGINLPVEFLKRWLLRVNDKITSEQVEKDFPLFEKDLKWQLIKNHLIAQNNISVSEEEVKDYARQFTIAQFRQYNISNFSDDQLDYFVQNTLSREEDHKKMTERKLEEKVIDLIKQQVTLNEKSISQEDFRKLFESEKSDK